MTAISDFDLKLAGMVAQGIPRDKAAAALRANGIGTPAAIAPTRDAGVLEKAEQAEVVKRFRVCGFKVYSLSQARASKQTPGLPDLWLMNPARALGLWWETKRQKGGRFSDAQLEFAAACEYCRVNYAAGDRYDAERWLIENNLADIVGGSFTPRRNSL
jgi:hypothetical protein